MVCGICINNKGATGILTLNKTYHLSCHNKDPNNYYLVTCDNVHIGGFYKRRFQVIEHKPEPEQPMRKLSERIS